MIDPRYPHPHDADREYNVITCAVVGVVVVVSMICTVFLLF